MKKIDFETSEPLFSLKETTDLISFTAMIIVEARKKKSIGFKEWSDYIDHWCETNYMPEEIKSQLHTVIIPALNALKKYE
jgi:hypothetical protein